jgi:hypothetical protein
MPLANPVEMQVYDRNELEDELDERESAVLFTEALVMCLSPDTYH